MSRVDVDLEEVIPRTLPRLLVMINDAHDTVHLTHSWNAKTSGKVMHNTIVLPLSEWTRAVKYAMHLPVHLDPDNQQIAYRIGTP